MIPVPIIYLLKDIQLSDNEKSVVFLLTYVFIVGFCIRFFKSVGNLSSKKEKPNDEKTT